MEGIPLLASGEGVVEVDTRVAARLAYERNKLESRGFKARSVIA